MKTCECKEMEILSNCCGAKIPQYPDYDICLECGEHCQRQVCEYCEETEHPYDIHAKGLKYDALEQKSVEHISNLLDKDEQIKELKKRNDELVEVLKDLIEDINNEQGKYMSSTYNKAVQALKNNSND